MWSKVWPFLVAILFFGLLISIHELGHFTFAKLFKVKVNEFALGMGPAIFKKKRGDTLYALRLLPIGGYVSMEGEDAESQDENAFNRKKVWQRIIIVAAGAIMNLILGVVIVATVLSMEDLIGTNQILEFHKDAISQQTGLKVGDEFLEIDGHRVFSDTDISFLMGRSDDGVFDMTVLRDGEKVELKDVTFKTEKDGKYTFITYDFIILGEETNFFNVVENSFRRSASIARLVWLSFFDLVTGRYGLTDLSGPVGTVNVIADAAAGAVESKDGLITALTMMAFISINIGIFNLIPLPALDGGRLFFLIIEGIRRKPINPKYEGYVHGAGLALLLLLMLVVTFNDIVTLIKN
ncbi:MAG: site-2 protease family protein [Clostridia bacterium]|nr:site-2 protease family protein [Clostridia bacterium]MBR5544162.1 site-2 protease family protein [Clostridia bacterium]